MSSGRSRHEIEHLFRDARFNNRQIDKIFEICKVIGKYMFVDRNILDARSDIKIGLSYLERAVINRIITKMQHEDSKEVRDLYYYQLGMGGRHLLQKSGERFNDMHIAAGEKMKSRLLTFNYFMLEYDYDLSMGYEQDYKHRFFFCKGGIICYFEDSIKEMELKRILIRRFSSPDNEVTMKDIESRFNFIPIDRDLIDVGDKTKTTLN
ncbi:hypothetical protein [Senegalia sp. (in: firmicutes)]|uniref:hypothetical protein n=1 Tax=Senegalia sp. (in: firmicutes) TaxID=1924098 RepID=UPI003F9E4944